MSNLFTTDAGRAAMRSSCIHQIKKRMSRFFARNIVVEFTQWLEGGKASFSDEDVLGELNALNDPEILNWFELLTRQGGGSQTFADLDFYVSENGDDDRGIGTVESPFATVSAVLNLLKDIEIRHNVQVLVQHTAAVGQTVLSDTMWYIPHVVTSGSLFIIGVGTPVETKSVQTLNTVTALGTGGHTYNIVAAPWAPSDWIGEFLRPTSGANADKAIPIFDNDASNLWSRVNGAPPAAADTFVGQIPAIRVQLDQMTCEYRSPDEISYSLGSSRFGIVNLQLDFSGTPNDEAYLSFQNTDQLVWLDFVSVIFPDGGAYDLYCQNSYINNFSPVNTTLAATSQTGITTIGDITNCPSFTFRRVSKAIAANEMTYLLNTNINRLTLPEEVLFSYNCSFNFSACEACKVDNGSSLSVGFNLFGNSTFGIQCAHTNLRAVNNYHLAGTDAIRVLRNSIVEIGDLNQADAAMAGFGLVAGPNVFVRTDGVPAAFTGVSGDINFTAPNPDVVVAWPAAGAIANDGLISSWVVQEG